MFLRVIHGEFDAIFCAISDPEGERFYAMVGANEPKVLERFVFVTGPRHIIPETVRQTGRQVIFPPLDGDSICNFVEAMRVRRDAQISSLFGRAWGIRSEK